MRQSILVFSLFGTLAFVAAFVLSFTHPLLVERGAREVVRLQVEREVGERLDSLSSHRLVAFAQSASGRTQAQVDAAREALRNDVPRRVADKVADFLEADCECRQRLVALARESAVARLASLVDARARLDAFIESAYAHVSAQLLREFRIFTGSNALALALLGTIAWVRRGASVQLLLPALALAGAVVATGGLYLFRQDWLHTILFGDYVGFAYLGWLAVVALLFADILLNRARVTSRMVNVAANALGSAAHAVPC